MNWIVLLMRYQMKIVKQVSFNDKFKTILRFIALDSAYNAKKFKNNILKKIINLSYMPYKCRKSIYFDDENIRDLIFKGYVVVYKIDTKEKKIIILGINKYQKNLD